jgi:hypothetical protein
MPRHNDHRNLVTPVTYSRHDGWDTEISVQATPNSLMLCLRQGGTNKACCMVEINPTISDVSNLCAALRIPMTTIQRDC